VSSFEGLAATDNPLLFLPPDDNLGVGPSHIFEIVNVVGRIMDKSGVTVSTFELDSFFDADQGFDIFDPMVMYDAGSGRWFATVFQSSPSGPPSSSVILAVSTSSDPTGTFCRYRLGHPTTETFTHDFPQLGMSDDKIMVSFEGFDASNNTLGTGYYVLDKSALLICNPSAGVTRVPPDISRFIMLPAQSLGSTSDLFMAMHDIFFDPAVLTLLKVSGVPGVSPVVETLARLAIKPWLTFPFFTPSAVQPGSSVRLATGDDRVLSAAWQNNSLWIAGNEMCTLAGDSQPRSCLRIMEIRTDTSTVRQDITYGSVGSYASYPAVRPDGAGNLCVVFTRSSASEFASVYATGRLVNDPLSTLQPSLLVRAGQGAQTRPSGRMGDYSGAALDPSDTSIVWVVGEYIRSTAQINWGTSIVKLTFPAPAPNVSLALTLNTHTVKAGDLVRVSVGAANSGGPAVLDLYFVIVAPAGGAASLGCADGVALVFFDSGFSAFLTCSSAAPQTFPPLIQSVSIPAGLPPVTVPNFFSFVWPAGAPPGTYSFALFGTPPGAFGDGSINQGDVTAAALDSLTF
jgi:hypothetical protein